MNKLDALIDAAEAGEVSGTLTDDVPMLAIRRILEAVREDMACGQEQCKAPVSFVCGAHRIRNRFCANCPASYHAALRAALEQL